MNSRDENVVYVSMLRDRSHWIQTMQIESNRVRATSERRKKRYVLLVSFPQNEWLDTVIVNEVQAYIFHSQADCQWLRDDDDHDGKWWVEVRKANTFTMNSNGKLNCSLSRNWSPWIEWDVCVCAVPYQNKIKWKKSLQRCAVVPLEYLCVYGGVCVREW